MQPSDRNSARPMGASPSWPGDKANAMAV
jgi:hypothetical protein